jgi:hypothetical protein
LFLDGFIRTAVDPSDVDRAVPDINTVDVWIRSDSFKKKSKVGPCPSNRTIDIKVVVTEPSFAIAKRRQQFVAESAQARICHVLEGFMVRWETW